ncbi:two-component system C4-dicarboxylate transport response regulator DctD [Plasticicumulans lactativorans]|uniref:Two-component system C4-dicarboxylate transport response regulator DctD n=1 Tax=Plasticicumulans lactativorans TaxID=1133106 RepID=A0A4R2LEN1_9GAMM|nr:sigma-54 dependent transcriptional regulator [Plasticicumulans lactativorans]TCO81341.1 two-component system C4-dicarboxylate transport response regulator DctD [Plasticicumulans lactativorans]
MNASGPILLVDDEPHVLAMGAQTLELEGLTVRPCTSAEAALEQLDRDWPGIVVSDIRMPGLDGLALLARVRAFDAELPLVLVTGHGDIATAVQAMRDGAYDFLEKPYRRDTLLDTVRRALAMRALTLENRRLRAEIEASRTSEILLLGRSPAIVRLRAAIADLADSGADILIEGETGAGKEVVARSLHRASSRRDAPFVALNCGAIPETIFESELFGHEAGAFTGASSKRIGKLEYAHGGTVFLDEIESMPLNLQVKVLRALQDRCAERLGSNRAIPFDIRVVAATKVDLRTEADAGRFRADLYYRLNVIKLTIPPLRDRREDIAPLFQHFVLRAAERYRRPAPPISAEVLAGLLAERWPGNVRELANAADRFVLGQLVDNGYQPGSGATLSLPEQVAAFERAVIVQELERHKGSVGAACEALGLPRKTLYDKLKKYGLRRGED